MEANVIDAGRVSSRRVGRVLALWPWLPLPVAATYLLVLLVKFNAIVASIYLDADAASAPVIGELFGGSPAHRQVFLGQMGWFSTLIFELATRWLPGHRQLWELAPYGMALASVALVCWGAWKVAGRWAAAISGVLMLCAGPRTLTLLFSLNDHSTTWFSLALLAALTVVFYSRPAWLSRRWAVLLALLAGMTVGVNTASDLALLVAGIVPVVLAAAITGLLWRERGVVRASYWLVGTMLLAGLFDALTHALMKHENVLVPAQAVHNKLAAAEALSGNFKLWWQSLMVLGNGDFFGQTLGVTSALKTICAVLTLAALMFVLRLAWRELRAFASSAGRIAVEETRGVVLSPDSQRIAPARIAWCAFWGFSALLLSASFLFSSNPIDINSSRYLVGVIYAVAALIPLLASRHALARAAIVAGALVFSLSGLSSLLQGEEIASASASGSYRSYNQIARLAAREGLTVGYTDYWDAAPLMWSTHFRLRVYPVQDCAPNLCWSYLHMITSWYTPRPHTRTFLISNSSQPHPGADPMPNLGRPSATYQVGTLTMYVYPYDIASRMVP